MHYSTRPNVWVYRFETDVKYLFIRDFIFENNLHAIQADCPQLF